MSLSKLQILDRYSWDAHRGLPRRLYRCVSGASACLATLPMGVVADPSWVAAIGVLVLTYCELRTEEKNLWL